MTDHTPKTTEPAEHALDDDATIILTGEDITGNAVETAPEAAAPASVPTRNGGVVGGTDESGVTRGVVPNQHPGQNGLSTSTRPAPAAPDQPVVKPAAAPAPAHAHPHAAAPERREPQRGQLITVDTLKRDAEVIALLQRAGEFMRTLGFTEHGQRHAGLVGHIAENVLFRLEYPERMCQLAHIAGYLHDIGNVVHREHHAQSGALMAYQLLTRMGMSTEEMALVMNAIGNHEEERGTAITPISSAIIIGDKADVHRSRVQNPEMAAFDIHDRVNYATTRSFVRVRPDERIISLELEIDTNYATVIEYFEIFLSRMTMMRQACEFLKTKFHLIINETRFT